MSIRARILSVGTANPPDRYTQARFFELFPRSHPVSQKIITSSFSITRHLSLPPAGRDGKIKVESQAELLKKHFEGALSLGAQAFNSALAQARVNREEIGSICCVTSTGMMIPSLSSIFIPHLGLNLDCRRLDLVGMGCSGGVSGLSAMVDWALQNPGKSALLLCCEICSAMFSLRGTKDATVANSIFGDGAAAVIIRAETPETKCADQFTASVLGTRTLTIPEHQSAARIEWNDEAARWDTLLSEGLADIVARKVRIVIDDFLSEFGLKKESLAHWALYGGGRAMIEGIQRSLELTNEQTRPAVWVLQNFGNLMSGSVFFCLKHLGEKNEIRPGDYGMILSSGPGMTIEAALIRW